MIWVSDIAQDTIDLIVGLVINNNRNNKLLSLKKLFTYFSEFYFQLNNYIYETYSFVLNSVQCFFRM
jgi:hypothetical protein